MDLPLFCYDTPAADVIAKIRTPLGEKLYIQKVFLHQTITSDDGACD